MCSDTYRWARMIIRDQTAVQRCTNIFRFMSTSPLKQTTTGVTENFPRSTKKKILLRSDHEYRKCYYLEQKKCIENYFSVVKCYGGCLQIRIAAGRGSERTGVANCFHSSLPLWKGKLNMAYYVSSLA